MSRQSRAGGAKKKPTRYASATSERLREALHCHRLHRYGEACVLYEAETNAHPSSIDAWANWGTALVSLGRASLAKRVFAEARRVAPTDARVARDAGIGLAAVGLFADARAAMEDAARLDPQAVGMWLVLGRLCLDSGDEARAVEAARRAVELAPHDVSAEVALWLSLFDDERPQICLPHITRALSLDASNTHARLMLAGTIALIDGFEAAQVLLHDPDSPVLEDELAALEFAFERRGRVFASKRKTLLFALEHARLDGAALEFGVRHGVSTRVLADASAAVDGFDSFDGLPESWATKDVGAFSTSGETPVLPAHVTLHVGDFAETLPSYLASATKPLRLVHIDSDLYSSAATVLSLLAPRLAPGVVIVFDEFIGHAGWREHEFKAWREAVERHRFQHEFLSLNFITGQAVLRIT